VSDFQLALKVVAGVFLTSATLAVAESAADAWLHLPLADFLVKKFADIMLISAGALAGIFTGNENRKQKTIDEIPA
jgi:hypothetical protein